MDRREEDNSAQREAPTPVPEPIRTLVSYISQKGVSSKKSGYVYADDESGEILVRDINFINGTPLAKLDTKDGIEAYHATLHPVANDDEGMARFQRLYTQLTWRVLAYVRNMSDEEYQILAKGTRLYYSHVL
ncbi:hypothetical protein PG993_011012 [Apiospora rasikravindrae]|uniref:Uncharacterized protein n=1 Tax=Apiospora rasikravindrae TaxID=990691 RepID=A0ABR1SD05_9PEZI